MNDFKSEYLVIEETSVNMFIKTLEGASNEGYVVVSSNLLRSGYDDELIYYALMTKKRQCAEREEPVFNFA